MKFSFVILNQLSPKCFHREKKQQHLDDYVWKVLDCTLLLKYYWIRAWDTNFNLKLNISRQFEIAFTEEGSYYDELNYIMKTPYDVT